MDLGLKDKVAIITGTGSQIGFGKGIALSLAKEGCDVIGTDVKIEGAEQTAAEVRALGRKALAIKVDVANSDEVDAMVKQAIAEFGKIDILINNAGIGIPWKPTIEVTRAEMDKVMNVNLFGQFNCVQAVLPHIPNYKAAGRYATLYQPVHVKVQPGWESQSFFPIAPAPTGK